MRWPPQTINGEHLKRFIYRFFKVVVLWPFYWLSIGSKHSLETHIHTATIYSTALDNARFWSLTIEFVQRKYWRCCCCCCCSLPSNHRLRKHDRITIYGRRNRQTIQAYDFQKSNYALAFSLFFRIENTQMENCNCNKLKIANMTIKNRARVHQRDMKWCAQLMCNDHPQQKPGSIVVGFEMGTIASLILW